MIRFLAIIGILIGSLGFSAYGQNAKFQSQRKVQSSKPKAQSTKSKTQSTKPKAQSTKSKTQSTSAKGTKKAPSKAEKAQAAQAPSIKKLQNERQQIQKNLREQESRLRENERNVKQRLHSLMMLNNEIADKRKTIDTIRHDINILDGDITRLNAELDTLQQQLTERKQSYKKSLGYMRRNRNAESKLMFIFSAKNFTQMYRRQRFVREYAAYQRAQGEAVKVKQEEVSLKANELLKAKHQKDDLLYRGIQEHQQLEGKQTEQQQVVNTLQKEQKTIQALIADQRKKDAALNAQIDRLIAEEVAKARARAEAEAKRKAAEEAARKRAEELARKKAAAEAAARENARRIAEAKAREAKLKEEAKAAARKSAAEKARAERAARAAEKERRNAERRAEQEAKAREKEIAEAKRSSTEVFTVSSEDRRLSGNFESNRGRLPMPITGPYRIVSHFGQYNVEGLKGVTLDNKGINLKGQAGAKARSIFDGEVSAVFGFGNTKVVMVRHGSYISVYCNLASVSVSRGQKVSTRQVLGSLTSENILQFQLRRETSKLNPEKWLGR